MARRLLHGAAAPIGVFRALAVIAWAAWTGFGVTVGLGGTVRRGLGAADGDRRVRRVLRSARVADEVVRRLALTCAVAAYGYCDQDRLVHSLLAELQRLAGLDSTFLGDIDTEAGVERIVAARNTSALEIPEALTIPWPDTVCRRSLDQGVAYTDDVPSVFGDSPAARDLGLQTYAGVPVRDDRGRSPACSAGRARAASR